MSELADRYAVACNYVESTSVASLGAKAYVHIGYVAGNLPERLLLVARSRGGRWVQKWENMRRLGNFRVATIPPQHYMYPTEKCVTLPMRTHAEKNLDRILRCRGVTDEPQVDDLEVES